MLAGKIVAVFACLAGSIFGQQAGYAIAGTTVDSGTHHPVGRVLVIITMDDGSGRQKACLTDANGAFRFENVPAGKYNMNAEPLGQAPQNFHGAEGFITAIAVGPGRDSEHILFELSAGAEISGTVTDEDGDPVQQGQVYLFRKGVFSGTAETRFQSTVNTNTSGRFHFGHLSPGEYLVAVSAQPWYTLGPFQSTPPDFDVVYPVTYYADALDPASASLIPLVSGRAASIQITMHAVPAVHVNIERSADQLFRGFSAALTANGPGGYPISGPIRIMSTNRHLEFRLAPGEYHLALGAFRPRGQQEPFTRKLITAQAGSDPQIQDEPSASVSGKITFNSPDKPLDAGLVLVPVSGGRGARTDIAKDGSFQFDSTPAGRYRIALRNAPQIRITQVVSKTDAYSAGMLNLAAGASVQLSVVAARAESRVDGIALKDGKPLADAMILLLPFEAKTGQYIGRDQSDSDGTFSIPTVPDGRYVLLAIDDGRDLAYRDPAVMQPYRGGGQIVTVPDASGNTLKINVLTRQK